MTSFNVARSLDYLEKLRQREAATLSNMRGFLNPNTGTVHALVEGRVVGVRGIIYPRAHWVNVYQTYCHVDIRIKENGLPFNLSYLQRLITEHEHEHLKHLDRPLSDVTCKICRRAVERAAMKEVAR